MISLADVRSPSFSGHESFPPRYGWLKKGIDHLRFDPMFFHREDALTRLGVGKNMVFSIRHWLLCFDLVELDETSDRGALRATDLGLQIFDDDGWDPFLEFDGTLWLLHWKLSTARDKATTWWWGFHRPITATFRREQLVNELAATAETQKWRANRNTIKRDVDCFVRTYLAAPRGLTTAEDTFACPLTGLGLIDSTLDRAEYILTRGQQPSLPDEVFMWAVENYIEEKGGPGSTQTLSLAELLFAPSSPGVTLCLNEPALIERLSRASQLSEGDWEYDETAGLQQLVVKKRIDREALLHEYFVRAGNVGLKARAS